MPRALRASHGGLVYHVLNRSNARVQIFDDSDDYEMFEEVICQARQRVNMRILSYCLMPNHWHMVLWPRKDGDLSKFMGWLTMTHAQRWHARRKTIGSGHLYQGRFKSFPIQKEDHYLTVCRYVERNALSANLVDKAGKWQWCSLWRRVCGDAEAKSLLSRGPVDFPRNWLSMANKPQTENEVAAICLSITRNRPYGDGKWLKRIVQRLNLESTLRPRGRPKGKKGS